MDNREFLIWTLVVPALLLSLSVWQIFRAVNSMASDAQYSASLAEDILTIRKVLARYPDATIRYKETGRQQPAVKALQEALQGQQHMERIAGQREITLGVAVLGVGSSVAVIFAGLLGLWGIRAVRQASLCSRAALVESFTRWQDRLAVVLCVLAGGLCCAVVSAVGFEFWDAELREVLKGPDMVGMVKIGIFLATVFGIGVYTVYKIWQAWRSLFWLSARQMQGQCITPEACPALWELVREVAECAKAQPPDTIVLGMEPTFFVMAGDVDLYPEGERYSGNMLYLSLPFMLYLTRDELISVVAHELGHYAGDDLEYSKRFLPIYIRTRRQLVALHDVESDLESPLSKLALEPATMLANNFLDALDSGVQFWSRQREFAADAVSAAVVGPRTAAMTLLRVVGLAPALDAALEQWGEIPGEEDVELEDALAEEAPDVEENQFDDASENERDTVPERSAELVNLVQLAAGPDGVLTFIRHVLQEQRDLRERGEQAWTDPLRTLHNALQGAVPHPLDTHPLAADRVLAWEVDVDAELVDRAMRLDESPLLWDLGLLQRDELQPASVYRTNEAL